LFIEPTVFADVTEAMTIGREEIFGPVQQIFKFETFEEAVALANRTRFGLAAGVVTKDAQRALAFAKAVRAGSVWVNCYFVVRPQTPFGGYKMSGIGREFGEAAINEYVETKTITINMDEGGALLFG
ncbi:PREDICTED: aldehyde dehydrogenase, cytosolic 2-like, partial [Rhagoletis zephyria]|uniref:aldehyde dehydrogenase, cytosolic 2-like n=1 Tax=Rhagoletis zephyria TaxID=28612 RepID=UPI0008112B7A